MKDLLKQVIFEQREARMKIACPQWKKLRGRRRRHMQMMVRERHFTEVKFSGLQEHRTLTAT